MVKHVNIAYFLPDPPLIWQLAECFQHQEAGHYIAYMRFANSSEDKSVGILFLQYVLHLYRQIPLRVASHPQSPPSLSF